MSDSIAQLMRQGVRHHQAGELHLAEQCYRRILQISPNDAAALHYLGVIAHQVGQPAAALELINRAIAAGESGSNVYNHLGEVLRVMGRFEDAQRAYRAALARDPRHAAAHANLGLVLLTSGRVDEAEAAYRAAMDLDPNAPQPHSGMGNVHMAHERYAEAVAAFDRALAMRNDYAHDHNNRGAALEKLGRTAEAEQGYRCAIELDPRFAGAMNNLAVLLHRRGLRDESMTLWQQATQIEPENPEVGWNLAHGYLARGDYARGWPRYELRWTQSLHVRRTYDAPLWDGSNLNGRTILLYAEQGFGDVIQFARFVPLIAKRGGRVILHCQPELVELMKTLDGVGEVVPLDATPPKFDVYAPLLSVPHRLNITLETLPNQIPYLRPPPDRINHFRRLVGDRAGGTRVGIVWGCSGVSSPERSCPLAAFAPIAQLPKIRLFSLQKGEAAVELAHPPEGMNVVDLAPHLHDFADTAAAVAALDLLVTIDTAAAHVAGGIGVQSFTLLPFVADWRWLYDRPDSPWYPRVMSLFRQRAAGDWSEPIRAVAAALRERSA